MEKKCKKAKWLSGEALQMAVKRREAKSKGDMAFVLKLFKYASVLVTIDCARLTVDAAISF